MIIDTSVLIAFLLEEPEAEQFMAAMSAAPSLTMSAASYLEAGIVVDRNRSPYLSSRLDPLIATLGITIAPVTESQARLARAAYQRFGKGTGHPAGLNFGDCFSYALAAESNEPLLYKGDDFSACDITSAL